MKSKIIAISLLFIGFHCIGQDINSFIIPENVEQKIDSILSEFNDANKPGCAIAVSYKGEIIFEKGYGSADIENDIPCTPTTVFNIASTSKQFTTFSLLLLQEQGKLSLNDDVRKYLPEIPDFGETITLHQLATHTSGLRDHYGLLYLKGWRFGDSLNSKDVLDLMSTQNELNFSPENKLLYSNSGYILLAEVVSRVSRQPFVEFVKTNIFEPLKMNSTEFNDDYNREVKNMAWSYSKDSSGYKKITLKDNTVGSSNILTTVEDLSKWASNFSTIQVGNKDIMNQMKTRGTLQNGVITNYAYGQIIREYKGLQEIHHSGGTAGYRSYLARYPDQNLDVVIVSNSKVAEPWKLGREVADLYLNEYFELTDTVQQKTQSNSLSLNKRQLKKFAGWYWSESKWYSRKIYVRNDSLVCSTGNDNDVALIQGSANTFQMKDGGKEVLVIFEIERDEKNMIIVNNKGDSTKYRSYNPQSFSKKEYINYCGNFYSEELDVKIAIEIVNEKLFIKQSNSDNIRIYPIKENTFIGGDWYLREIKFVRGDNKEITGMKISSDRTRNVLFTKVSN